MGAIIAANHIELPEPYEDYNKVYAVLCTLKRTYGFLGEEDFNPETYEYQDYLDNKDRCGA